MTSAVYIRIASILTMLHCILHTAGGVFGSPKFGAEQIGVIENMKLHHFNVMGSMRSNWDFFFGYGLFVALALFVQAVLFWQLAAPSRRNEAATRSVLILFCLNYTAMAIVSWRYFFVTPAVTELFIAVCLGAAFALNSRRHQRCADPPFSSLEEFVSLVFARSSAG